MMDPSPYGAQALRPTQSQQLELFGHPHMLAPPTGSESLSSYPQSVATGSANQHHPYQEVADPKKLRSYGKNDRKVLELARKLFTATTCSIGLFFMRKDARNKADYDMYAIEALSQAKYEITGMYFSSTAAAKKPQANTTLSTRRRMQARC
jgi:hypothetical protein